MSNTTPRPELLLDRRHALIGLGAAGAVAAFGLTGCSDEPAPAPEGSGDAGSSSDDAQEAQIDAAAYDELVASAPVADDAVVEASDWASKIRDAGSMRVGGVQTSLLFCLMNEKDNKVRGFDAGLFQMLARYILGDENAYELTQVTSDTRESVLTNDQVDAVFATYSITDERKKAVSFAGPYFVAGQDLLVRKDDNSINGPEDLNGKRLCSVTGSTSAATVKEKFASEVQLMEQPGYAECATALFSGIVDAVTTDDIILAGLASASRGKLKVVGKPFTQEYYGVGIKKGDTQLATKINNAIVDMIQDGSWENAISDNTKGTNYTPDVRYNPPTPDEGEEA